MQELQNIKSLKTQLNSAKFTHFVVVESRFMTKEEANFLSITVCGETLTSVKTSGYKNPTQPNPTKKPFVLSLNLEIDLYIFEIIM